MPLSKRSVLLFLFNYGLAIRAYVRQTSVQQIGIYSDLIWVHACILIMASACTLRLSSTDVCRCSESDSFLYWCMQVDSDQCQNTCMTEYMHTPLS